MHLTWDAAGQYLEGVGVETELEYVPRFALDASQLRVDRFIRAVALGVVVNSDQKVRDAANTLVDEGHLVDDVVTAFQGVTDPGHPLQERLVGISSRYLVDASPGIFEFLQAVAFVLATFFDQQISQRTKRSGCDDQRSRVSSISQ